MQPERIPREKLRRGLRRMLTSFTPQHLGFSNLSYATIIGADGSIEIAVKASHLMEPNPHFALVVSNLEEELEWAMVNKLPFIGGFDKDSFTITGGGTAHCIFFRPIGGTLTPAHPLRFLVKPRGETPVQLLGLHHQKTETEWVPVPVDKSGSLGFKFS